MSLPSFTKIPGFDNYYISKCGLVWDSDKERINKSYKSVYMFNTLDKVNVSLHRLLALTFIKRPVQLKDVAEELLDVNHIDGNKMNNDLSNLEWCTRQENCVHAYKTGLRTDNTPILVKDLRDNTVTRFYSLQECARFFHVNGANIHYHLALKNYGKVVRNFYVLIREGDEWPNLSEADIGNPRPGEFKAVLLTSLVSDRRIVFETISECARFLNMNQHTLSRQMRSSKQVVVGDWQVNFVDDPHLITDVERINRPQSHFGGFRKPVPISVENTVTGERREFESLQTFAQEVNVKKDTLQKYIWKTKGLFKDWKITYKT